MITKEELLEKIILIKNATKIGENTADRIGGVMENIVEYNNGDILNVHLNISNVFNKLFQEHTSTEALEGITTIISEEEVLEMFGENAEYTISKLQEGVRNQVHLFCDLYGMGQSNMLSTFHHVNIEGDELLFIQFESDAFNTFYNTEIGNGIGNMIKFIFMGIITSEGCIIAAFPEHKVYGKIEINCDLSKLMEKIESSSTSMMAGVLSNDDCYDIFSMSIENFMEKCNKISSGEDYIFKTVLQLPNSGMSIYLNSIQNVDILMASEQLIMLANLNNPIFVLEGMNNMTLMFTPTIYDDREPELGVMVSIDENSEDTNIKYKIISDYYDILWDEHCKSFDFYTILPTIYTVTNPVEGDIIFTTKELNNLFEALQQSIIIGNFTVDENNPKIFYENSYHSSEMTEVAKITEPGNYLFEIKNLKLTISKIYN